MCQSDFPAYRGQMEYVCLHCGQRYPGDSLLYSCGGVFLLENTKFDELKQRSGAEWREIFDRRASTRSTALRGIFRYYELLAPLLDEEDIVYLGEGLTPIVEAAPALRVWACPLPTRTTARTPAPPSRTAAWPVPSAI